MRNGLCYYRSTRAIVDFAIVQKLKYKSLGRTVGNNGILAMTSVPKSFCALPSGGKTVSMGITYLNSLASRFLDGILSSTNEINLHDVQKVERKWMSY